MTVAHTVSFKLMFLTFVSHVCECFVYCAQFAAMANKQQQSTQGKMNGNQHKGAGFHSFCLECFAAVC